eukprot:TRINITY_DN16803_c0_g1_i1.p1 TRINITY_DN16803_c0_g1~~TRINITY_DN16803_c0_g1_i1.p1  ORF type:complete len:895 (+),score=207.23 TRINITY_DN16803_c0_g1_i1:89-2773(+)
MPSESDGDIGTSPVPAGSDGTLPCFRSGQEVDVIEEYLAATVPAVAGNRAGAAAAAAADEATPHSTATSPSDAMGLGRQRSDAVSPGVHARHLNPHSHISEVSSQITSPASHSLTAQQQVSSWSTHDMLPEQPSSTSEDVRSRTPERNRWSSLRVAVFNRSKGKIDTIPGTPPSRHHRVHSGDASDSSSPGSGSNRDFNDTIQSLPPADESPRSSGLSFGLRKVGDGKGLRFSITRRGRSDQAREEPTKGLQFPIGDPDKYGWLDKKGDGVIKRFRRRWCELHGRHLYYASTARTQGEHGDALGRIDLAGVCAEVVEAEEKDKFAFEVRGILLPRTYLLLADSPEDRASWLLRIREASQKHEGPLSGDGEDWLDAASHAPTGTSPEAASGSGGMWCDDTTSAAHRTDGQRVNVQLPVTDAERVGWLEKKGDGLLKRYKRRWCELHGRYLYYAAATRQPGDPAEGLGRIDLAGARVEAIELSDGRPHTLQIKGPHLPRTYHLAADSDDERTDWIRTMAKVGQRYESGTGVDELEDWLEGLPQAAQRLRLDDFVVEGVIGRGTFGKVCKVRQKGSSGEASGPPYAMKVVRKAALPSIRIARMMMEEKAILQSMKHPYIVRLYWAFQTQTKLYLVLTYLGGGDLKHHLTHDRRFSEPRTRFYTAEVLLALDHLHSLGIVYRDLKPQNVVLDDQGHAVLTDLGLATDVGERDGRAYTFCGTPQYVAPEVLQGQGYAKAVDFWALGVMVYELLVGATPFQGGDSLQEMFVRIMEESVRFPQLVTKNARDFISPLLERDPARRLSSLSNAKPYKFLKGVHWPEMRQRKVAAPWVPSAADAAEAHSKVRNHTEFCAEVRQQEGHSPADDRQMTALPRTEIDGEFDGFTYAEPGAPIKREDV